MFTEAERRLHRITDPRYDALVPKLRTALLSAHFKHRQAARQVIVIVSGADGAGKGELVHRLNEWLDPRGVETHAFWDLTDEEREHPHMWRYWRAMPGNGRVGIFFGSWYTRAIIGRVMKERKKKVFAADLARIARFERMLTDAGTALVKLWLHMPKEAQRERLEDLEREGRIGPDDWKHFKRYDRFREISEVALAHTHTEHAPWQVVDARDRRYREITAGRALLEALRPPGRSRNGKAPKAAAVAAGGRSYAPGPSRLAAMGPAPRVTKLAYERELKLLQGRLSTIA